MHCIAESPRMFALSLQSFLPVTDLYLTLTDTQYPTVCSRKGLLALRTVSTS